MPITSTTGLVDALRQYRVLSPAQLDEVAGSLQARFPDAHALARELLQRGWLTTFQVNQLVQERGAELLLGPYVLLDRLGEGGMGTVFKAHHQLMDRTVALKVIRKEYLEHANALQRFQREIRLAAQLDHPHLVRAYDAAQVGDTFFLVMEHVEGTDLQRLVQKSGPLPVGLACAYIRQAALGLQHAAERGLVHRDVKPSNLQVTAQGTVVKVLDMGMARSMMPEGEPGRGSELTQTRMLLGTPDYMAPEQIADARCVDVRTDVYSLGCTFYFLLAGRPPFPDGEWQEKLVCHRKAEPRPIEQLRPEVPPMVGAVLRKMMAKRPEDRYATAAEVADALAPFAELTGPVPALDMAALVARPQAPTVSAPQVPGASGSLVDQPAGYEPGWTLEANSSIEPTPPPVTSARPNPLFSEPTVLAPARYPASPAPGEPISGLPAHPTPRSRKLFWLLLAGGGGTLGLLILLLILLWPIGGNNPPPNPAPPLNPAAPPLATAPFGEAKARELQQAWAKHLGRKAVEELDLGGGVRMEFVLIPPGTFTMGSPKEETGRQDNEVAHKVTITKPFYLSTYAVTQEQYERVSGDNPSCFKAEGPGAKKVAGEDTRRFPVEQVTADVADAYCVKLGRRVGRNVRLPTEAEWEYACRAGTTTAFHLGTQLNGKQANCEGNVPYGTEEKGPNLQKPCRVGSYPPNAWGLCDMHGNVWQWCADWYGSYVLEDIKDPQRCNNGEDRVMRGGSWGSCPELCRAAFRGRYAPATRSSDFGCRVCLCLD